MSPLVRIATRTYPPDVGAAPFRLRALARALVARGCDVEVVTTSATAAERPDAGVRTRRLPVLRDGDGVVRGYLPYLSFDVPLTARLLTGRRPDVVVHEPPPTTGVVTRLTSRARGVPYVSYLPDVWAQGAVAAGAPRPVLAAVGHAEQLALRGAARVLAVTRGMADEVVRGGVDPARIRVVGNGVDVDVFRPAARPAPGTVAGQGIRVVYSGTMSEWQGAGVFVRAFALLAAGHPGARLTMVGGGVDVPRLRELARAVPGVELPGTVAPERAAELLAGADVALASLVPGSGYDLMSPTKIYAATACGTPVLFAGVGSGARTVADHDLGWAVAHDPHAVADVLARVRTPTPARRARLREWALQHGSLAAAAQRAADAVTELL
ncbi:glycosyltransferase family 4 protein [Kineococcus sp. SYSU DK001]|uniref:glycosyltransferase family 4 protein n=1 Tax=Kineococcus sp. SYSU DK001 TaxID=3383122 RepID=UPI003D7D5F1C